MAGYRVKFTFTFTFGSYSHCWPDRLFSYARTAEKSSACNVVCYNETCCKGASTGEILDSLEQSFSWEANNDTCFTVFTGAYHSSLRLSQINKFHLLIPYCFETNFKIILQFMPISSHWSILLRFSNYSFVYISQLSRVCRACSAYFIFHDLITVVTFGEVFIVLIQHRQLHNLNILIQTP
jgi:hypothetical protein